MLKQKEVEEVLRLKYLLCGFQKNRVINSVNYIPCICGSSPHRA